MLKIKSNFIAISGLALFAVASTGFAGRYGDADIRHWQQVKEVQESRQLAGLEHGAGLAGPAGEKMTIEGKTGKQLYKRSPFQRNGAG